MRKLQVKNYMQFFFFGKTRPVVSVSSQSEFTTEAIWAPSYHDIIYNLFLIKILYEKLAFSLG